MRILVVEDDELTLEFLKKSLTKDQHMVDPAVDGAVGFDKALSRKHDLVILDVVLPSKDGISVCADLRELGYKTPILILSSQDTHKARVRGLDAGADDYVVKPFSYDELSARIRALVRRPNKLLPAKLKAANIELDPATHQVKRGDKVIDLRPKEYLLLEYLMRNANRALSREELLQRVWGIGIGNTSNRLDVYIRHLRTKIDEGREHKLIRTVRGKGYMLVDAQLESL
ncbi:MAG: response regulator transcription factor [Candidatus Saccharimonadales bacterium]|nr:response regulator transcription factor [Candidatus Saccharimonadales bacterium]